MTLLAIFALLSLILAAVGIYSIVAFMVSQRTHEIGIRIALGAQPASILRNILSHGMMLTSIGIAIGLAGAFALTRLLQSLLYGVTTTDHTTFIASAAALLFLSLIACYIPARRALQVDPMTALKE
jgi:putative ABC transport system permease protein